MSLLAGDEMTRSASGQDQVSGGSKSRETNADRVIVPVPFAALKILMVAARFPPFVGGIETHVREVGCRLVQAGHAVTILTADPQGTLPPSETILGMEVVRVRSRPSGRDWCFAPDILRFVERTSRQGRWDIVHVQGYHTFSAPFAMLGALRGGAPFVLTFHSGGHSSRLRTAIRAAQCLALAPLARRAARLVGVSRFEADHFSSAMHIDRDRFEVVPNGASLPPPAPAMPSIPCGRPDAPLVVSLGRLERYKGHHRAIEAFVHLRRAKPAARLRILGQGPYEPQLRRMVDRLGLSDAVRIGGIPAAARGEMAAALSEASVIVLLSDYEAHPVAVMEALSLGRRVVTTDTSGFRELAGAGLVTSVPLNAPAGDVAAVLLREIAEGASSPAATPWLPDWNECSDRLASIYRRALVAAV